MLEYNNSQLADTGRSWKWHQQGGVCLELAHPADLMAIVEAVPSKPGKTIKDSLKLGVLTQYTLTKNGQRESLGERWRSSRGLPHYRLQVMHSQDT